ncbi:MAG: response regulator [Opitutus sp.]|nr:response regulator [Opitutus sp.]
MNSGPLSDRMNSGAPCCAMADCTSRRTSAEPIWRSGRSPCTSYKWPGFRGITAKGHGRRDSSPERHQQGLHLPPVATLQASGSHPGSAAGRGPGLRHPYPAGRLLVVEDDSVNRQVIDLFLKKMGLTPTFAFDGEAAIATATSETFDVVLMDCQLPDIDGLEAVARRRAVLRMNFAACRQAAALHQLLAVRSLLERLSTA